MNNENNEKLYLEDLVHRIVRLEEWREGQSTISDRLGKIEDLMVKLQISLEKNEGLNQLARYLIFALFGLMATGVVGALLSFVLK